MKIARVFHDTDMRNSYPGLLKRVKDAGLRSSDLGPDTLIVFINRKGTYFKCLISEKYILSYNNGKDPMPLEAIKYFPQFFDGREINMKAAIEKTLRERLKTQIPKMPQVAKKSTKKVLSGNFRSNTI